MWPELETRYALRAMVLPSALLTVIAGFFLGVHGFLAYAGRTSDAAVRATEEMGASIGVSALSLFAFALLTPLGWLAGYLFVSGFVRIVRVVIGDAGGDPLLSLVDGFLHRRAERQARARAVANRERWEGPEVPDVVRRGLDVGWLDVPLVVVASRLKPGWEKGVTVVTPGGWFQLGAREDRHLPEGLRALYPLQPMAAAEVLRRSVSYDHPALSGPTVEDPGAMREAKH